MKNRTDDFHMRMTEEERIRLEEKARCANMTSSSYLRSFINSKDGRIRIIDTEPLSKLLYELNRHGNNLNQFMRFLNTYGPEVFNASLAEDVLTSEQGCFDKVGDALISLKREASKERISIVAKPCPEEGEQE